MADLIFWGLITIAAWIVYEIAIRALNELQYRKHVRDWESRNDPN